MQKTDKESFISLIIKLRTYLSFSKRRVDTDNNFAYYSAEGRFLKVVFFSFFGDSCSQLSLDYC